MHSRSIRLANCACVIALAVAVVACGDDDTDINAQEGDDAAVSDAGPRTSGTGQTRAGTGGARASAGRGGGGGGGSTAGTGVPPVSGGGRSGGAGAGAGATPIIDAGASTDAGARISAAQIFAVTAAANTGEIQLGALALTNAQLMSVRDFAQSLIMAHSAAQERQAALAQSLGITPVENSVSTQVNQEAAIIASRLQLASGAQFDLSYVQSQIDIHTRVLDLFDELLLPNATDVALRTELTLARTDIVEHLVQARALIATLGQTPVDSDAGVEDAGL